MEEVEKASIEAAPGNEHGAYWKAAALALGMTERVLLLRMNRYGPELRAFSAQAKTGQQIIFHPKSRLEGHKLAPRTPGPGARCRRKKQKTRWALLPIFRHSQFSEDCASVDLV